MSGRFNHFVRTPVVLLLLISSIFLVFKQVFSKEIIGPPMIEVDPAPQVPGPSSFTLEQFYRGKDNADKEFGSARSDHAAIALDIGQCYHDKIGDPIHWSPSVRTMLLFELDEHLMHSLTYLVTDHADNPPARGLLVLNPFHAAAIYFSDRISRDRLEVRRELEDNRSRSWRYQAFVLIFGACATIFISIKSIMQGNTKYSSVVGVFAVIFSASGAAISSMSAFDGSQAVALRDQRTLSQLQQLHWRVASDVVTRPELCKEHQTLSDDAKDVVGAWRDRLEAILDTSVDTVARPGNLNPQTALKTNKDRQVTTVATGQ